MNKPKLIIILILFLSFLTVLFLFFRSVYRGFKNSRLIFLNRINSVIFDGNILAISTFEGKKSGFVLLPTKEKVIVSRGFGEYELGKVYPLGNLEKKGGRLLLETIQENFNIPVSGYFISTSLDGFSKNPVSSLKSLIVSGLFKKIETNFNFFDLVILLVKSQKISGQEFEEKEFFSDKKIRAESLPVAFMNGTDHDGLAQKAADLWENIGGRIVQITDYQEKGITRCLLISNKEVSESYSFKSLSAIYGCECREIEKQSKERSDIILVVGEEYWKRLTEKW